MSENTTHTGQTGPVPDASMADKSQNISDQSQDNSGIITLIVQDTSIQCKKSLLIGASPYFAAMFRGDFAETHASAIPIHDVTGSSIQAIVEQLKGERWDWDTLDPLDILYTASVLQLDGIQADCVQFISNGLNTQSCLSVMFMAEQLGLTRLYDSASLMSQWAFETIIESDSFRSLSYEKVNCYLSSNLRMSSEGKMVEAICIWVNHEEPERKRHMKDLLQHVENSQLSFTELLCHSYQLNDYAFMCNCVLSSLLNRLKLCTSHLQNLSSTLWAGVQLGRIIEEKPLMTDEKLGGKSRDVPAKVYVVATGVRRHPGRHIYPPTFSDVRVPNPPEDYLQSKLYYLCPDQKTLKLSSLNSHLQKENIGTAVKIFPVESEVWVVAYREESVSQPVMCFWKFNAVVQRWVYVTRLPPHIRDFIDWLVYVRNHVYILYEPFGQVREQIIDVYNVLTKQWTQTRLPQYEDMKNLDIVKSAFFPYKSNLYVIGSWFNAGITLEISSHSVSNEWKRINWCSNAKKDDHEILHCVVDKADIYGLSFSGLFKLDVQGENVLRCDYISEYKYGDMHNDHDICFRLFSKTIQMLAGRIYCWRKAETGHLSVFDVEKRKERDIHLEYETSEGSTESRWHGFHIVLDSCFALSDKVDSLADERNR